MAAQWERVVEHAPFSIRDTAEPLVFGGAMWLSNGYYYDSKLSRDLWRSTDGREWELVSEATPYDGYSELVAWRGKMWAVKASVWSSADGRQWEQVLDRTPFGVRGYGETVVWQDRLWQLGSGADVWSSADGKEWTCAAAELPFGNRYAAGVVAWKDRLWLLGGAENRQSEPPEKHYPAFTTHNDVWTSADGAHWERVLEYAPWAPRMWFAAQVYQGRLWVLGGFSNRQGANLGDVWHTGDGVHWVQAQMQEAWSPRHEPSVYDFQGDLWMVAGNSWPLMNDVWRLALPGQREQRGER